MTAPVRIEEISMRSRFVETVTELLDEEPATALVLADVSASLVTEQAQRHPDRVLNVGIRESLMVSVAGGLALTHQGVSAMLVSVGASYDWPEGGRTHQSPGDVALLDSLPEWTGEPYLAGTSTRLINEALSDRPHRMLALGVGRAEQRRYGTPEQHDALHGVDAAGLRRCISEFLTTS